MFRPAKLLIVIVGKYGGDLVVEASRKGGAKGGTRTLGWGMSKYFAGCDDIDDETTEALLFSLMFEEANSVVHEVLRASLEDPENIRGMALVIDAAAMIPPGSRINNTQCAPERAGSESMGSDNTLITCIITHGQADEIMRVARTNHARGGTILNARGTGTEEDVKFFGISLALEKEMLLIVAKNDQARSVLDAVVNLPTFSEPGGGIIYTTPVEEFHILGR